MVIKKVLAIVTMTCIVISLLIPASYASTMFKDISESHWAYESIKKMNESGIMIGKGTSDGIVFDPNGTITGAEMYMTAYRIAGMPTDLPKLDFEVDISSSAWYTVAHTWCMYNGLAYIQYLLTGGPIMFQGVPIYSTYVSSGRIGSNVSPIDPDGFEFESHNHAPTYRATRTDIVLLLYYYVTTYLKYDVTEKGDLSVFTDFDLKKLKADEFGISAASFTNAYLGCSYTDEILPAWEWAVGSGIIKGCGDGTLQMGEYDTETKSYKYVTRAEYVVILDRFIEYLESLR